MNSTELNEFDHYRAQVKEKLSLEELQVKIKELREAKGNVIWLLDNPNGFINMRGLKSWAEIVENLVKEIKDNL